MSFQFRCITHAVNVPRKYKKNSNRLLQIKRILRSFSNSTFSLTHPHSYPHPDPDSDAHPHPHPIVYCLLLSPYSSADVSTTLHTLPYTLYVYYTPGLCARVIWTHYTEKIHHTLITQHKRNTKYSPCTLYIYLKL